MNAAEGSDAITLSAADGASAAVHRHGAHVTSWRPAGGDERLFLSRSADYSEHASIRGGIPVVFPQFANLGGLPKHGFARVAGWHLEALGQDAEGCGVATLTLHDNDATRALWPHAFAARLRVQVGGAELVVSLSIRNSGDTPFAFTAALHNYLAVDDIAAVRVLGLHNRHYRDSAADGAERVQHEDALRIDGEVDRIYLDAPREVLLREPQRQLAVRASGFPDVVVWNPGAERGAALADLEPGGYARMLCIEAAAVGAPLRLEAGESWTGEQQLHAAPR